jgi:pyruvate dehydrogenase E2 component (dihydrolipoamide acetyltransferase)
LCSLEFEDSRSHLLSISQSFDMAIQITLPGLGEGVESGDVLEILVSVGDVIKKGQNVVEMETDKATAPVPSPAAGRVTKISVSPGQTVPVGGLLMELDAVAGAETPAAPDAPPQPKKAEAEPSDIPAAVAPARPVKPVAPTPPAPVQQPEKIVAPPVATVPISSPVAPVMSDDVTGVLGAIPASPAIRRFAREVGVDLSSVSGTGGSGRITRDDILAVVRQASHAVRSGASSAQGSAPVVPSGASGTRSSTTETTVAEQDDHGPVRIERMSKIRKTIAAQMHLSWSTVPRVTNFDDADITNLEQLRQSSKDEYAAEGLKLTTMPFLIKAVAAALKHHPLINANIEPENERVIYKEYVNIGVAVDTDRGLVVPVLRNADRMSVPEITRALAEMAGKVRSGQFPISDLRGGTFTISNLGAIGGQYSTPIVNSPEVAILLVGRSRKLPVVMPDDSIKPRLMMPLSLSYDHRLVDGGAAARFLNDIIGYLEAPSRLLLAL